MRKYNCSHILFLVFVSLILSACEQEPTFEEQTHKLPVIKLSIDQKYLWSLDSGLYIVGTNGIFACKYTANYNQKWEFPAQISYYEKDELIFEDHIGFRIKGKCSRQFAQKSIGLYWRSSYGNKNLKYPLFDDLSIATFKRLNLRNSGNDFGRTHLKDAALTNVFKDYANVDFRAYKPAVIYLNEHYWGIQNIREMITPHHFDKHYGVNNDEVDLLQGFEHNPSADDGSVDDYNNDVVAFLKNNSLDIEENYLEFEKRIDVNSYMDYMIIQTYVNNKDWPGGNVKWWRDKTSADFKRWRWVVYDLDFGFKKGKENREEVWIGDLYHNWYDENLNAGYFIFNHLLKNPAFKQKFLERYLFFIQVVFEPARFTTIVYNMREAIDKEYMNHQKKWNTLPYRAWVKEVNELIEFNTERNELMKSIILDLMNE